LSVHGEAYAQTDVAPRLVGLRDMRPMIAGLSVSSIRREEWRKRVGIEPRISRLRQPTRTNPILT
jgi:hypothetical protein